MEKLIALLFLARDLAHREAIVTKSRGDAAVLRCFACDLVPLIDKLAHTAQGVSPLDELLFADNEFDGAIDEVLEMQNAWIDDHRGSNHRAVDFVIDEIQGLFLRAVHQLRLE